LNITWQVGVLAYAVAALACLATGLSRGMVGRQRHRWWLLSGGYVLLFLDLLFEWRFEIGQFFRSQGEAAEWESTAKIIQAGLSLVIIFGFAGMVANIVRAGGSAEKMWRLGTAGVGFGAALLFLEALGWDPFESSFYTAVGPIMAIGWGWILAACMGTISAAVQHLRTRSTRQE
jgi:hypothetical protein